jgi:radical SAM superfamily enzyme YgiQ (UPF0313 family)
MKVLFVVNDVGFIDPISVALLSGVARDLGHERYLCILKHHDLVEQVDRIKPDVIAYSLNSCDAEEVFKEHSRVKGTFSIMGGSHPTLYPDSLKDSGADAYCIGEGEQAFADVLRAIEQGQPIDDIPNIHTLKRQNEPRNLMNLDDVPFPDRDLVLSNTHMDKFPRKTFLTSRGCPHRCTYCFNSALRSIYKGKGKWVRRFSVDRVIKEIQDVKSKYNLTFVKFDDDNFAIKPDEWLEEFVIKYRNHINLPFNCLIRLESATDNMLSLLKEAGCYSITTSIDSANERIRETILHRDSKMTNQDIVEAMQRVKKHGINLFVNYITAIPTALEDDELDTVRLSKSGSVVYSNYTALVPFKGTQIWDYCKEHNLYDNEIIPKSLLQPSAIKGFSVQQGRIQRNVLLLGAYNYMIPKILLNSFIQLLKKLPVRKSSAVLYSILKSWLIGRKIYHNDSSLVEQIKVTLKATRSDLRQL